MKTTTDEFNLLVEFTKHLHVRSKNLIVVDKAEINLFLSKRKPQQPTETPLPPIRSQYHDIALDVKERLKAQQPTDTEIKETLFIMYRGYKIEGSIQGIDIRSWDGEEWRYLLTRKTVDECKQFIDLFLKTNEL